VSLPFRYYRGGDRVRVVSKKMVGRRHPATGRVQGKDEFANSILVMHEVGCFFWWSPDEIELESPMDALARCGR
jgi:hypothetical protein